MPDPQMMTSTNLKFETFEQDRMNMSRRMFQSNGMGALSPKQSKHLFGMNTANSSMNKEYKGW